MSQAKAKSPKDISRLYIGNLDPTIDEYALVKLFEPFGKITLMDFLFHWTGPKRGQPRGYCFLEYSTKQEALKAIDKMNNRMIKGRPLTVSFAIAAPSHEDSRKGQTSSSSNRPNLLTVMKTQKMANASTDARILAIEKKLAALKGGDKESSSTASSSTNGKASPSTLSSSSKMNNNKRYHPY
ncbi:hypothetical protein INT43_006484 [Umbelopsis isabellina]|uniref:Probable RNA-binding protein 18 n=1 Tax=Mortierella isabellina TaxID=91625 RepID=A0A8H7Q166_MORIS|nr:hypothetical protein INT43_006484 [Umbelopsis isabellina]